MKFYNLGDKSFETDFRKHVLSKKTKWAIPTTKTIQGVDVKFSSFYVALESWQTAQTPPWKVPPPIEK